MKRNKNFADRPLETCTGDPGKNWGLASWPWLDLGTEEAAAAVFPSTAVTGGEGPGVEEHKEVERDLGRRSGRAGVVGGGPATELCSRRRRRVAAVVLWRS
jgi:hypothetical protein